MDNYIEKLNPPVRRYLFLKFLEIVDLCSLSKCSTKLSLLANEDTLWEQICCERFGRVNKGVDGDWKKRYKDLHLQEQVLSTVETNRGIYCVSWETALKGVSLSNKINLNWAAKLKTNGVSPFFWSSRDYKYLLFVKGQCLVTLSSFIFFFHAGSHF